MRKPVAVKLGGGLPAAVNGRPHDIVIHGKILPEIHAAEQPHLHGRAAVFGIKADALDTSLGIVRAQIQPCILPQIRHHLRADHVGKDGITAKAGIFGLPMAEIGLLTVVVVRDQHALVIGQENLSAVAVLVILTQSRQGHERKIHPLDKMLGIKPLDANAPSGTSLLLGQVHLHAKPLQAKAAIHRAVLGRRGGGSILGTVYGCISLGVAQTQSKNRRRCGNALLTAKHQRGDLPRGKIHGQSHIRKL